MKEDSEVEDRCVLCPPSGPPPASSDRDPLDLLATAATDSDPDDGPGCIWISCSRCGLWYHSVCLLLADVKTRETVPSEIRQEIEGYYQQEGPWTKWVDWIDKW